MSCDRITGRWPQPGRLIFSNVANAQRDDHLLELDPPSATGVVTGRFLSLAAGNPPLADTLTGGLCAPDGIRSRLTFTRNHAGGNMTTVYTGIVILLEGTTTVMIRNGRFTRTIRDVNLMFTTVSGDWETEKPT